MMTPAILIVSRAFCDNEICFKLICISGRIDRYSHDLEGDDTDEADDSPLFASFSSYSPQFKKQYSRLASDDNNANRLEEFNKILITPELRKFNVSKFII